MRSSMTSPFASSCVGPHLRRWGACLASTRPGSFRAGLRDSFACRVGENQDAKLKSSTSGNFEWGTPEVLVALRCICMARSLDPLVSAAPTRRSRSGSMKGRPEVTSGLQSVPTATKFTRNCRLCGAKPVPHATPVHHAELTRSTAPSLRSVSQVGQHALRDRVGKILRPDSARIRDCSIEVRNASKVGTAKVG